MYTPGVSSVCARLAELLCMGPAKLILVWVVRVVRQWRGWSTCGVYMVCEVCGRCACVVDGVADADGVCMVCEWRAHGVGVLRE